MKAPNALLRIVRVNMQALTYARVGAPSSQGVRRMTKIQEELLMAEMKAELSLKIPCYLSSPEEWASAVDASTDAVTEIAKKYIKEDLE